MLRRSSLDAFRFFFKNIIHVVECPCGLVVKKCKCIYLYPGILLLGGGGGGGGEGGALPAFFFFFPCLTDHERDWPPCNVVFFGLATNSLNVRNNIPQTGGWSEGLGVFRFFFKQQQQQQLLTIRYYHRGTRLNATEKFCIFAAYDPT